MLVCGNKTDHQGGRDGSLCEWIQLWISWLQSVLGMIDFQFHGGWGGGMNEEEKIQLLS